MRKSKNDNDDEDEDDDDDDDDGTKRNDEQKASKIEGKKRNITYTRLCIGEEIKPTKRRLKKIVEEIVCLRVVLELQRRT